MAIAVGLVLAVAVLASLLVRKEAFVVLVAAAVVTALWELSTALAKKAITVPIIPLAVGAVGMLVSAYVAGEDGLLVSFTLTCFGVLLWRIIDGTRGAAKDVAAAVFVAAYVPFLAGFSMLMLAEPDGQYRVIVFIAVPSRTTSAATPAACSSAGTRWLPRSARRSRGKGCPGPTRYA